ncbi:MULTISPECIES: DUF3450 domain-containing protein [unclassified Colwellia]|uniref:DUF3450 domain-containing protein n=1 Tax=unclassified Colwellia TaxID=196834 RepID=UPI0015F67558|nr:MULTISPECIES: DUF3450 domain-containing protein [unclassified Colwellia]MBA6362894.1 DUF3450 domain-containing protein [Colwellia sp. BRX8-8]MBA6350212.1 DUF3450 domain-containing protein [Colwellia sp. BRX8-9]MBA6357255.1 DUF3450 domain-containing protein [Colwellia sp. BRX8-3]MBA6361045.1 DUF3450 domain-containing protein [Colwellia sp. BRX8-6]MBA6369303.1 DUF3450 domain-containing protein [Colwellia sp. BRX8-5]
MTLSKIAQACLLLSLSTTSLISDATPTLADNDKQLSQVVDAGKEINQSASQSQQRVNAINEQIQTKSQHFKTINKEIDGLTVYNQQMKTQVANQLKELDQIAVSMEQVSIIERQVSPLMARMIETLANFITLDVQFLTTERNKRIADLHSMMERADVAISEKFRRVLAAYQIEVDYGRTIEAYSGLIDIDGSEQNVDFLRIGRVSLVYQTRDGQKLGLWDNASKSWQPLSAQYRLDINKGLRIARKQLAPDLIIVPVTQNSAE